MADTILFTFAELEFVLRSVAAGNPAAPAVDVVRRRLALPDGSGTDVVTASGVASLLARGLCREEDGRVVPGDLVLGAVAALSTRHTVTEAAGWIGQRPTVVHVFSGTAARLILSPGSFGLFTLEVAAPTEPLSGPLLRFFDLCTGGDGEAAVIVRSSTAGDPDRDQQRLGVAAGRAADGTWYLSDAREQPDTSRVVPRQAVVDRLIELFGTPVGV